MKSKVPILMLMFLFFGFVILACEAATGGEANQTLNRTESSRIQTQATNDLRAIEMKLADIEGRLGDIEDTFDGRISALEQEVRGRRFGSSYVSTRIDDLERDVRELERGR